MQDHSFTVTITLSCITSDILRNIGRKSRLFHLHLHSTPPLRGGGADARWNIALTFGMEKLEWR